MCNNPIGLNTTGVDGTLCTAERARYARLKMTAGLPARSWRRPPCSTVSYTIWFSASLGFNFRMHLEPPSLLGRCSTVCILQDREQAEREGRGAGTPSSAVARRKA
jgi:hypothetical protein